jgi:exosome complex exonuclease DIS3/RRP44
MVQVKFVLDAETQNPLDVQMYALKETNALVEEFMLLANITVAKKILRHFPTLSLLRRHPAPAKTQFAPLVSAAKAVGLELGTGGSGKAAVYMCTGTACHGVCVAWVRPVRLVQMLS